MLPNESQVICIGMWRFSAPCMRNAMHNKRGAKCEWRLPPLRAVLLVLVSWIPVASDVVLTRRQAFSLHTRCLRYSSLWGVLGCPSLCS